jgi:hypothetical protein
LNLFFFRVNYEKLEVNAESNNEMDFGNIVNSTKPATKSTNHQIIEKGDANEEESDDFIDDPEVPPLI